MRLSIYAGFNIEKTLKPALEGSLACQFSPGVSDGSFAYDFLLRDAYMLVPRVWFGKFKMQSCETDVTKAIISMAVIMSFEAYWVKLLVESKLPLLRRGFQSARPIKTKFNTKAATPHTVPGATIQPRSEGVRDRGFG